MDLEAATDKGDAEAGSRWTWKRATERSQFPPERVRANLSVSPCRRRWQLSRIYPDVEVRGENSRTLVGRRVTRQVRDYRKVRDPH